MARRILMFAPTRKAQRYPSPYDAQPPRYTGPDWIGKQIKAPPYGVGPQWVGKRASWPERVWVMHRERVNRTDVLPASDRIGA